MPTYEYACKKCGERFDVVQSFDDEPLKKHKGCGGAVRRVFGSVGIAFKGSGFYKNDSRSSSKSSSSSTESSSSSDSSSSDKSDKSDKSDTKAEKSEAKTEKSEKSEKKADKKPAKATTK
ncbi:MAG: FmdB family transcriptional regulator [Actinobacteria bacterium]|nr:FmdB family transcriptional regulator [Actinomycetota bacterium]